ncbi:MAG: ABC transporter ATP-binding protein/permease [Anaerolineae bacterium]|nr:ABC transporter ATP-binding protein/permease [Anaerolineae bacterium]
MGFFDGLDTEGYDRQYDDKLLPRIFSYLKPYLKEIGLVTLLVLFNAGLSGLAPMLVSTGLDRVEHGDPVSTVYLITATIALIGTATWVGNWIRRRITARIVADASIKLATDAFEAATKHDLSFYDEYSSGKVLSRITSDPREFGQLVLLTTDIVALLCETLAISVVMFYYNWQLSLLLYIMLPPVFWMATAYRGIARKVTADGMRAMATVNATIRETISGIAVAKNFRQEMNIYNDFVSANKTSYRVNLRRGLVLALVIPSLDAVWGILTAVMVYAGGFSVAQGFITIGAWYLFILALDRFAFPLLDLSSYWANIQAGLAASERIFALIDAQPAVNQKDYQKIQLPRGQIEFKQVSFRYKNEEPVLKDFNLCIKPGENLAIVGHTGAGKSSIAKLIARFYEFQEGSILIDGFDIRSFDLSFYRRQLGIVTQVPFLFDGSVADNIRYGNPTASDAEILKLARQIGDGEWLDVMSDGLNTAVGERGAFLSMGQRQLVSLMRVLVQKPVIFILDEATASIDPFTEWQIQQGLNLVLSQTTSILIAHRLSTIQSADRILVLDSGSILEEGTHNNLMERGGHYAKLYNTYFRHQSLDYIEQSRQLAGSDK